MAIKKMSQERYRRLGGKKRFTASFSKKAIKKRAQGRQIYRLNSGAYVARKPRKK